MPAPPVLRTFMQNLIPFCSRSKAASDVISGWFVKPAILAFCLKTEPSKRHPLSKPVIKYYPNQNFEFLLQLGFRVSDDVIFLSICTIMQSCRSPSIPPLGNESRQTSELTYHENADDGSSSCTCQNVIPVMFVVIDSTETREDRRTIQTNAEHQSHDD